MARAGVDDDLGYPTGRNAVLGPPQTPTLDEVVVPPELLNHATRVLTSKAIVHRGWARSVFDRLVVKNHEVVAPSPGIDLDALARHTAWAVHEERKTTKIAAWLFWGGGVGMLVLALWAWPEPYWWLLLALAVIFVVAAYIVLVMRTEAMQKAGREMARAADHMVPRRHDEALIRDDQRRRLDQATVSEVIVYREGGGVDVFPGFGVLAYDEVRPALDVGVRPHADPPVPGFTAKELLDYLVETVGDANGQPQHVDGRRSMQVLHFRGADVWGLQTQGQPYFWPLPERIPNAVARPSPAERAYMRAQVVHRSGQLVTTLHLSVEVRQTGLSLHPIVHVLRRIDGAWNTAKDLEASRWRRALAIATQRGVFGRLASSPLDWARIARMERRARREPDPLEEPPAIVDPYGSRGGLRHYSIGRGKAINTDAADIQRDAAELIRATYGQVIHFLEQRGLNPVKYSMEEETLVTNGVLAGVREAIAETVTGDTPNGDVEYGLQVFEGKRT
jgi:hypothetical protein